MGRPIYGQVVVGPPGSGKTTYCNGMQQYLRLLGRNAFVINLDPANERISQEQHKVHSRARAKDQAGDRILPYDTIFDVCQEVINITSVMKETGLGPNGGLVYCMEYLEAHLDDVVALIQKQLSSNRKSHKDNKEKQTVGSTRSPTLETFNDNYYLLLDLPGQVELYTHSTCVQKLLQRLTTVLDLRLAAVQLIDAQYCTDASKFLSAALLATTTLLRLELPTVSVLSKIDLLMLDHDDEDFGESDALDFQLEYYTECFDLERLVPFTDPSLKQVVSGTVTSNEEDESAVADDQEYQAARKKRQSSTMQRKHTKLHQALAEVVQDFGLLQFSTLDISNAASVGRVLAKVDKCNGYVFVQGTNVSSDMFQCAVQQDMEYDAVSEVKERHYNRKGGK
ncbi:hypothetical protein ACA910_001337 [Epithemia clementina (nom. ined.)]